MLLQGLAAGFAAQRPRGAARARLPALAAAASGDGAVRPAQAPKKPTRRRMMDALMREAERRKALAEAAPPTAPPAAAKKAKPRAPKAKVAKAAAAPAEEEEEMLDLSAFMVGGGEEAVEDEEGSATSWGGSLDDADEAFLDEGGDAEAGGMDDESEFLTLNAEPLGEGEEADDAFDTWAYDSVTGELVHKRLRPAGAKPRKASPQAVLSNLGKALKAAQQQAARDEDEDDDDDDDDDDAPYDSDEEAELEEELRVPTRLQRVDADDEDAVIKALNGLSTAFLDKESQALLEQEVGRKKKELEKKMKRVADTNPAPPEGKRKTHKQLQIIAGTAANYKLWSPQDMNTRPMMAAVRGAVFSMLTALSHGNGQTAGTFPPAMRWLDLFAGTGAVGIEAASRGCEAVHFVELDPWVIQQCLQRNLEFTRTGNGAVVHNMTVESFVAAAAANLRAAGDAPFDFISVCPPYEKVSYPQLLASLEASPLLQPGTLVVVEYPKYERKNITDRIGRLDKIRDRAYGRTLVAIYECLGPDESTPRRDAEARWEEENASDSDYEEEEEEEEEEEDEEEGEGEGKER